MPASKPAPRPDPTAWEGIPLGERVASELELLARNVDVLQHLSGKTPIGIIRLSEALNLPIHKVRYSLHLLEREGVIQPSADGAVVTDQIRQYWDSLNESLNRMSMLIQQLKDQTEKQRVLPPNRKGY
jgi:predicted transcriptional regulator